MTPEERIERRRASVRKAVRKWRQTHREVYNAYSRLYLSRPKPKALHKARCARYRKRRKLGVDLVCLDVAVPPSEIQ